MLEVSLRLGQRFLFDLFLLSHSFTNACLTSGAALGRFDRLLQIRPRAERGPAFFSKGDNLGHLYPLAACPSVIVLMQSHVCTQPVSAQQSNQMAVGGLQPGAAR